MGDINHSQGRSQLNRRGGKPVFQGAPFSSVRVVEKRANEVKGVLPF